MTSSTTNAPNMNNPFAPSARITFTQLQDMSDDPARNRPGPGDLRAILHFDPEHGFFLFAQDADALYLVIQGTGDPLRFRTIKDALGELLDVPGLHPAITLVRDLAVLQR